MKISLIGFGNIGSAVTNNLVTNSDDHELFLANRSMDKIETFAAEQGDNVHAVSEAEAVKQGDVIILAMWLVQQMDFISRYHDELAGKVIVDPSNPIAYNTVGEMRRTLPDGVSSGEVIRDSLPTGTGYIKAFGTLAAESLAGESSADRTTVLYYATNSAKYDAIAEELINASGYTPINAGIEDLKISGYSYLEVGGDLHQYGGLNGEVPTKVTAEEKLSTFKQANLRPTNVLEKYLAGAFSLDTLDDAVETYVADDAEYISLNFENETLQKIEPWAGTSRGKDAFKKNFTGVLTQWEVTSFSPEIQIEEGDTAMMFGKFSLKSKSLGQEAGSPMAAIARVVEGKIVRFIYLEDTLATALTFKKGGELTFNTLLGGSDFTI